MPRTRRSAMGRPRAPLYPRRVACALVLLSLLAHSSFAAPVARAGPPIASPLLPLDDLDVWWAPDTVADMTRAVVRVRPVGRGLALDDAVGGVAPVAAGVLLRGAGGVNATSVPRLVVTTWRGANPGFTRYALDWVSGETSAATLLWADPARPVAVLAVDGDLDAGVGVELGGSGDAAAPRVDDPVATVGLAAAADGAASSPTPLPSDAWIAFTSYVYDRRAHLPRNDGAASALRGAASVMTRALLARPKLGAGNGVFDVSGRLIGLDIQDDLTAAGLTGWGAEAHALPAAYVADAVRDAMIVWRARQANSTSSTTPLPIRGDLGVAWTAIPVGAAIAHHGLPPALAAASRPAGGDGPDGPGSVPRVLKVGAVDAGSPAAGVVRAGDILLAVDGGPALGDDVRALDAALTAALRAGRNASLVVSRRGARRDVSVAPVDVLSQRTTRAVTFGGCTFQDIGLAATRRFQLGATPGVLVASCDDPALAPVATMLARSADMQSPMLPVVVVQVGGTDVANVADFAAAARRAAAAALAAAPASARPLPIPFAFIGAHVGNSKGYSMVDGAAVPRDAAAVVEYKAAADGAWVAADNAAPPATPADVVRRTLEAVNRAPAGPAPPPEDAPLPARRPGSAPGWPSLGAGARGGTVAGVDGDDAVDVDRPALTPLRPALAALAALPRGPPRSIQSSGAWNASTIASFKRSVVYITMHEMWPLENYGAAPSSAGSGFIVDRARGILATNAHVAGAFAGGWEAQFIDGTVLEARQIWYSNAEDIAFLKVDPDRMPATATQVTLGSWTDLGVDTPVHAGDFSPLVAVGNPARFQFVAVQGAYVGGSFRTNEAIGGARERNVGGEFKALMQSAGGASGSACFDGAGRVVGALFAGGETADPRFAGGAFKTEAIMVAADYVRDALDDGVRDLAAPARGSTGLELDLVPLKAAASFYGLDPDSAAAIRQAAVDHGRRPRDKVVLVAGFEPATPPAARTVARPGDILFSVAGVPIAGDMRALDRAVHASLNGTRTVDVVLLRNGTRVPARLPVADATDRVHRFLTWSGAVFHDVTDRTRYMYRIPYTATPGGVFMSHADDASAWPRYGQHERRFQSKAVISEVNGVAVRTLDDLIAVACGVQGAPSGPVAGSVTARDVQDDDAPGGAAYEMWYQPGGEGGVRVFAWDAGELEWRGVAGDPCARAG